MKHALTIVFLGLLLLGCTTETVQPVENVTNETPTMEEPEIAAHPIPLPTKSTKNVMTTDTVLPDIPVFDFSNSTNEDGKLVVHYFYSPNCIASQKAGPVMDSLEENYSEEAVFFRYSLAEVNGSLAYAQFANEYNLSIPQRLVPQVLVNGTIITDKFNIEERLGPIIGNFSE